MFLVVMVLPVQNISLDKVRVYGMAMFMLCLFMCNLSIVYWWELLGIFVGNVNFGCGYFAFCR